MPGLPTAKRTLQPLRDRVGWIHPNKRYDRSKVDVIAVLNPHSCAVFVVTLGRRQL